MVHQGDANLSQEVGSKDNVIVALVIVKDKAFLLTDSSILVEFRQTHVACRAWSQLVGILISLLKS
jgi:hypothetical protein